MPMPYTTINQTGVGVDAFRSPFIGQRSGSVLFSVDEAGSTSFGNRFLPTPSVSLPYLLSNSEMVVESNRARAAQSKSVPLSFRNQFIDDEANTLYVGEAGTPAIPLNPIPLPFRNQAATSNGGDKGLSAQPLKLVPDLINSNGVGTANDKSLKPEIESERHNALVFCWKLSAVDAFLVVCSGEQPRLRQRIQCHRSYLPLKQSVSLGKFYTIEYSRYTSLNSPHVRIFVLNEASYPLETRLIKDELQLRVFIWRAKELYWSEFCEVTQMPEGSPDVCMAWCKLKDKLQNGLNTLAFVELIDDLLKLNAKPVSACNGSASRRQLDAIELDELYGSDKVFDSDLRNGLESPDSITAEIECYKISAANKLPVSDNSDEKQKEQKKFVTVYMQIKRTFHPWIKGPFGKGLEAMDRAGVNIEFRPNSNDLVLSGIDRARVEEYADKLRSLRDGPIRRANERKCRVAVKLSKSIAEVTNELLAKSGAIIVLPAMQTDVAFDLTEMEISLLGSAEQIAQVWDCLRELYGPKDIGELIAVESSEKELGDEKILRRIAAAQQKSHPSATSGGRKMETQAEPRKNGSKIGNGKESEETNCQPSSPFSSSHCPRRSNSPAFVTNAFHNSRAASCRLGSMTSLAANRSKTPCQTDRTCAARKTSASTLTLAQIRRKQVEYPDWQWRYLVGNNGEALAKMVREVQEASGHQQQNLCYDFKEFGRLHLSGPTDAVEELYTKVHAKICLLNRNGTIVKDTVSVERQFHCQVIGKGGEFLRKLKKSHGVKEICVPSEFSHSDQIRIEGPSLFAIRSCKEDILKLVDNWRNDVYEEVHVERRFVPMIRGKNSNKIIALLDGLPKVEVDLPPHTNDAMAADSLIKIRGHRSEVSEFIGRLKVFIEELSKKHNEEFIRLPLNDPNHSSLEFAKFICAKKKQIELQFTKLKLEFQSDDELAQNSNRMVRLNGPTDQVDAAKAIVLELIERLRNIAVVGRAAASPSMVFIACDQRHNAEFLRNNGQLLKEIKEEHGTCKINLNKCTQRFELCSNRKSAVDSAKAHIERIINTLESKIHRRVFIPSCYYRKLGPHLSSIREQFNVRIQMPSKDTDEDPILLTGPDKISVEAAERKLRSLCSVTEHIEVSAEHRASLIGRGGAIVQELIKKYSVQIDVPRGDAANASCNVSVSGAPEDVRSCLVEIREHILPITRSFLVSKEVRGSLIGSGGKKVKQLCDKYFVKIHFTCKDGNNSEITVTGRTANVEECERYIVSEIALYSKSDTIRRYDPFGNGKKDPFGYTGIN